MAILQSTILASERYAPSGRSENLVKQAKASRKQTAFLSHSHQDARLAKALQGFLIQQGWEVYIDWEDTAMPDQPDRSTADRIKTKIRELDWFLFLATNYSMKSRWCPWEIGYADGAKPIDTIVVIPTADDTGSYGSEYLDLYRRLDHATRTSDGRQGFAAFSPKSSSGTMTDAIRRYI